MKKISVFLGLISVLIGLSACGNTLSKGKVNIVTSFNAVKEIAEAVGGEYVMVSTIIPNGSEPHEYEPKTSDMICLDSATMFAYSGLGMESWVEKTLAATKNKKLVAIDLSKGIIPIKNTDPDEIKEHGQYDPHIWLSLKSAALQAETMRDALVNADPAHKDAYNKNCAIFEAKLSDLQNEYSAKFKSLKNKRFVTGHAAFAYLSRDFGLEQNSVEDVFAEGEPSAKKLAGLVEFCKKNKIKTIFVEDMVSPKVSETLASEVGAKAQKIYTLESKEDNKDYIQSMRDDLEMVYQSLK
jgi:zinc transport system substrate-binding protein